MTHSFADELQQWGPGAAPGCPSLAEARTYCRRLATRHYENFPVVSWLLPRGLQQPFYNIYAYCRWADDLGDEVGDPARALELLAWWRNELQECYAGRATHPVFVALRPTIAEFEITPEPFADLISAFEQDQTVREYETFTQLEDYCRRSANPVGRLVLALFRQAREEHFHWSDSICTGLQLANFWQDVSRDLDIGRIYLPREDRERFGYSHDDLVNRRSTPAFRELLRFEVERTRGLLSLRSNGERGVLLPALRTFPWRFQVEVEMFARGGLLILDRIAALDYQVLDRRPVVRKRDFAGLLARCLASAVRRNLSAAKHTQSQSKPQSQLQPQPSTSVSSPRQSAGVSP